MHLCPLKNVSPGKKNATKNPCCENSFSDCKGVKTEWKLHNDETLIWPETWEEKQAGKAFVHGNFQRYHHQCPLRIPKFQGPAGLGWHWGSVGAPLDSHDLEGNPFEADK